MTGKIPRITLSVLFITALLTGLQFVFPVVLTAMQRTPAALSSGEVWRLITPIFINRGGWPEITFNFVCLILVGTIAERIWGGRRWLIFYLFGGVAGELAGLAWRPEGAGSSVAVCGLLGALSAWLLLRVKTWPARAGGTLIILGAITLTLLHNLHGPPLIVGVCLASWMLWREAACTRQSGPDVN